MELAKLFVTLAADTSSFAKDLVSAGKDAGAALNPIIDASKGAEKALEDVTQGAKDAGKALGDVGKDAAPGLSGAGASAEGLAESLRHVDQAAAGAHSSFKEMLAAEAAIRVLEAAWDALRDAIGEAIAHLGEVDQLNAQTAAAIKSTGGAAGVTAQQIQDLSGAIEKNTGVSGEAVQRGANLLLTFTNIRNAAGANNDIFTQTTKIMADMSVAMGQDMKSSALQLGKALNDPAQGMSALQRVGVAFTESQKATVAQLQATGHMMEAQKIILRELTTEFGGSAEAYGKTLPGAIEKAKAAWENMTDAVLGPNLAAMKAGMTIVADAINDVADAIQAKGLIKAFDDAFGPNVEAAIVGVGAAIVMAVIPALFSAAAAAAPFIATAAVIAFAARPIIQYWSEIPGAFSAYFSLAEATVLQWYQTLREVAGNVYTAFATVANDISSAFGKVFGGIGSFVGAQFNKLPDAVRGPLAGLGNAFSGFVSMAVSTVASLPGAIGSHVTAVAGALARPFANAGAAIGKEFSDAYQIGSTWLGNLQKYIATFAVEAPAHMGKVGAAAGGMGDAVGKGAKKAADEAAKQAKAIDDTFAKLDADLASIQIDLMLDPAMDGLKAMEQQASVMKGALKKLMQEGIDPLDADFVALKASLASLNAEIADTKETEKLFKQLEEVDKELTKIQDSAKESQFMQAALGKSYDGTSDAIKRANDLLKIYQKQGLAPTDAAVKQVVDDLNRLKAVDQDRLIEDWAKEMTQASEKGFALGKSFDVVGAQASITTKFLEKLSDAGIHSGLAFDTLSASHVGLAQAQTPVLSGMAAIKQSASDVEASVNGLKDGLNTLGQAFGVNLGDGLVGGIAQLANMGLAVIQVSSSIGPLSQQLVALGTSLGLVTTTATGGAAAAGALAGAIAVISNPVTLITGAILGVVTAGVALINNWDAIKSAALGFFQGIASAASKACGFIINNFHDAWERIKNFFTGGTYKMDLWVDKQKEMEFQAEQATAAIIKQGDEIVALGTKMKDAVNSGFSSAIGSFLDGTKTMSQALREGVKKAIIDGIVEAMLQKTVIMDSFGGLFDSLTAALHRGDNGAAAGIISQIGAAVPRVAQQFSALLQPLQTALSSAFAEPTTEALDKAISDAGAAMKKQDFARQVLGQTQEQDLSARIGIVQKALTDLHAAGADGTSQFAVYQQELKDFTQQLKDLQQAAKDAASQSQVISNVLEAPIAAAQAKLGTLLDQGKHAGDADYDAAYAQLQQLQGQLAAAKVPAMAKGGLATGPVHALIGEGADDEAVMPLNDNVFSRLAAGIVQALPAPAPAAAAAGGNVTINVNYTGNGKWTRDDVDQLGDLLVGRLRTLGIRPS